MNPRTILLVVRNQITSINIRRKRPNIHIVFKPERKSFGFVTRRQGFYDTFSLSSTGYFRTLEEITEKNCYVENNNVFYKPYVVLNLTDGKAKNIVFPNEIELDNFLETPELRDLGIYEFTSKDLL